MLPLLLVAAAALSPALAHAAPGSGSDTRTATVLPRETLTTYLEQKITGVGGSFGSAIAVSGDTAVVGASGLNSITGSVYVFAKSNGVWEQVQELTASDGATNSQFGYAVALDGDTLFVSAGSKPLGSSYTVGAVYVFKQSNGIWTESAKLLASDATAFGWFGRQVAVSGHYALITGAPNGGSLYAFKETESGGVWTWNETQKLVASDGGGGGLGFKMVMSGTNAMATARLQTVNGNANQGKVYAYARTGDTWAETQIFTGSDSTGADYFGSSVALDGTTAIVGANGATVDGTDGAGAAYVFKQSPGGSWAQTQKLVAADRDDYDLFGASTLLVGSTAVIGAIGAMIDGSVNQGKVYTFKASGDGTLVQADKFVASDGQAQALFGNATAVDGDSILVCALGDAASTGAVYVYSPEPDLDLIFKDGFDSSH